MELYKEYLQGTTEVYTSKEENYNFFKVKIGRRSIVNGYKQNIM